ncbi:MAG: ribosomal RNA small subunit methyltransferase A [Phycisphaerales bacterium]|nr:ribosomal RNA small subunit methyltransferase A [Phycisphaerales bacterium]
MQSLTEIRELLASHGLAPKKSLGQNFLIDHNLIRKLVDAAAVGPGSLVLEVGPGTGTMTEELLARGAEVVACELDAGLAQLLRERFGPDSLAGRTSAAPGSSAMTHAGPAARFTLIEGDCLEGKRALNAEARARLGDRGFSLVSNLPYGAGTPLMSTLLTDHPRCGVLAVTVQREVADRLAAKPGSKEYGALSVIAQALAEVESVASLPPECFWPRPDVTSRMVVLRRRAEPMTGDAAGLAAACRVIFAQRRKQLGSVLGRAFPWPGGIRAEQRAEELGVREIVELAAVLARQP